MIFHDKYFYSTYDRDKCNLLTPDDFEFIKIQSMCDHS